jgi:hypothetical protein
LQPSLFTQKKKPAPKTWGFFLKKSFTAPRGRPAGRPFCFNLNFFLFRPTRIAASHWLGRHGLQSIQLHSRLHPLEDAESREGMKRHTEPILCPQTQ